MDNKFEKALTFTLKAEGGFTVDRGGPTNYGVTQTTYNAFLARKNLPLQSVKKITLDEAKRIYFEDYWLPAGCEDLPLKLSVAVFDFAVNSGVSRACRYYKKTDTWETYVEKRKDFLKGIGDRRYIKGWMNRITNLKNYLQFLPEN